MPDIYDSMPDGDTQRAHNKARLAELERDTEARQARLRLVLLAPTPGMDRPSESLGSSWL